MLHECLVLKNNICVSLYGFKVLSGHGKGPGVPVHVLVCAVSVVCDRCHSDQCVWFGVSYGLLLLPALRHTSVDQAITYTSGPVGLSDHIQCGCDHFQEHPVCE